MCNLRRSSSSHNPPAQCLLTYTMLIVYLIQRKSEVTRVNVDFFSAKEVSCSCSVPVRFNIIDLTESSKMDLDSDIQYHQASSSNKKFARVKILQAKCCPRWSSRKPAFALKLVSLFKLVGRSIESAVECRCTVIFDLLTAM